MNSSGDYKEKKLQFNSKGNTLQTEMSTNNSFPAQKHEPQLFMKHQKARECLVNQQTKTLSYLPIAVATDQIFERHCMKNLQQKSQLVPVPQVRKATQSSYKANHDRRKNISALNKKALVKDVQESKLQCYNRSQCDQ